MTQLEQEIIESRVLKIIREELDPRDRSKLTLDTILTLEILDSAGAVSMVMVIEDEFEIPRIPDSIIPMLTTPRQVVSYVKNQLTPQDQYSTEL